MEKKLNYCIYLDPSLNEGTVFIPTMIVQPFVENAMLHGIMHKESDGEIHISFKDHESFLEINVKDNGVGRKAAAQMKGNKNAAHTSLGIEVTRARLMSLHTDSRIPSGVQIVDLEQNGTASGTLVKIFVPQ